MTIKSSSRFDRINKLDRDYWYWQILSVFCTLKARAKLADVGIRSIDVSFLSRVLEKTRLLTDFCTF